MTSTDRHRHEETSGMRLAFWTWTAIIVAGLAIMIVLPLAGR